MTDSPSDEIRRLVDEISSRAADPAPRWTQDEDNELLRFQVRAYLRFAGLRLEQNRPAEAAAAFHRVLELDRNNAGAYRGLGDIARDTDQAAAAVGYYRRALELNPEDDELRRYVERTASSLTIRGRVRALLAWRRGHGRRVSSEGGRAAPPAHTGTAGAEPSAPAVASGHRHQASHDAVAFPSAGEAGQDGGGEAPTPFPWEQGGAEQPAADEPVVGAAPFPGPQGVDASLVKIEPEEPTSDLPLTSALADLLVGLLEYDDPYYRGGSSLTRLLAVAIGREIGLSPQRLEMLGLAAVLRDLGRQSVGEKLLPAAPPSPKLDVEGQRRIEHHVQLGLQLLEGLPIPGPVLRAIRHHHERWDGNGYPDGLKGEQIPLLARIVCVADAFSAMIRPRPHRLPRRIADATAELRREAGRQFDRDVVEAALRFLETQDLRFFGLGRSRHVLVVHPDAARGTVLASKLCTAGYLAEVSRDFNAARTRMHQIPVEALFVTAELPLDEAVPFLRELRNDPGLGSIPVLGLDADSPRGAMRLLTAGADAFFGRNAEFPQIRSALGALMGQRTRQRSDLAGPRRPTTPEDPLQALGGDLEDFGLNWLLQMIGYHGRTAALAVRSPEGTGVVYLEQGDPRHAEAQSMRGEEALAAMLGWKTGKFAVYLDREPPQRTIHRSLMNVLLDQAVESDHTTRTYGAVNPD